MLRWTCVLCVVGVVSADVSRVIQLKQGPVKGYKEDGVFTYYNIPYATAPTGPHKYKAPLPPPTNQEPFDAVAKGIICPQVPFSPFTDNLTPQENCLIANVFVPDTNKDKLPVMVEVHGGAYQLGSGNWLSPKNLVRSQNVIVVTFNYRLSILGFLCLGTDDVPGNAGMKDQVALLRWVKNNIAAFGGNPNDVTISGCSAGGSSVDLLVVSKATKGLFNKAIPQSGSSLSAFSIQSDPLETAKLYAKRLNFTNTDDIYALEEFYKTTPWEQLMIDSFLDRPDSSFVFSPCIERTTAEEAFLDEDPLSILKNKKYEKVPMVMGFANMEGLMRINVFETWKDGMNKNFSDYLPTDLQFKNEEEKQEVIKQIKQFYFGGNPVSKDNILSYVDYFSDVLFVIGTLRSIELHLQNNHKNIYLYVYAFTDKNDPLVPYQNVRGANHCGQMMAIMDANNSFLDLDEGKASDELKKMKSIMRNLWSNFIKTGKPVSEGSSLPTWPTVKTNWGPYMWLGQSLEVNDSMLEKRIRFWNKIYEKHYRQPLSPPAPPKRNTEL